MFLWNCLPFTCHSHVTFCVFVNRPNSWLRLHQNFSWWIIKYVKPPALSRQPSSFWILNGWKTPGHKTASPVVWTTQRSVDFNSCLKVFAVLNLSFYLAGVDLASLTPPLQARNICIDSKAQQSYVELEVSSFMFLSLVIVSTLRFSKMAKIARKESWCGNVSLHI